MIYNILQYLEENVQKNPGKLALADENESMTYEEYMQASQKIGTYILNKIPGESMQPIAVLIDRNIRSICTFMGAVYSGNFYVPVDASMPEDRIKLIYDTLNPIMVIDARKREGVGIGENASLYSEIIENTEIDTDALAKVRSNAIDTDPLYVIFTSGSTGVPKGVLISHRSVIDLVNAFEDAFEFDSDMIFGNQAPFDFDVSVKDIYNSLKQCASLQVLPKKLFKMPKLLVQYLKERKVDTLIWAVSALRIVADFKTLDEEEAPALKNVMFSGEIMPVKALNYWIDHVKTARFVNLYGPTEITCNCTYQIINERYNDDQMIPVGKPFKNTRVFLRNDKNEFVNEQDVVGEICVMGTCLALGYYANEEKTKDAFIQNLVISAYDSKIYATGDMGYYNEKGEIVFASRRDYQIKHMGHRIELGELEVALNAIPFITISCCLYDKVKEKIVCFYQAEKECKKEIVMALSKKLPKYMWPNVYTYLEEMPMNKNGKIDRNALSKTL